MAINTVILASWAKNRVRLLTLLETKAVVCMLGLLVLAAGKAILSCYFLYLLLPLTPDLLSTLANPYLTELRLLFELFFMHMENVPV